MRSVLQSVPDAAEPFSGGSVFSGSTKYSVTVPTPLRVTVDFPANIDSEWKYRTCGWSSKMANKENAFSGLRYSVVLAVKDLPFHAIPQPGENPNDGSESFSRSVTK